MRLLTWLEELEEEGEKGWTLILALASYLIALGALFFLIYFSLSRGFDLKWWQWVIEVVGVIILLCGITQVDQQERAVIEVLGRFFKILHPGPHYVVPFFMAIRERVSVKEKSIPLFAEPIKIDFKDGSANPKGARVFFRVKDDEKNIWNAVYFAEDREARLRELLQNALRSYLNHLTLDEGLQGGKAGYDFFSKIDPGDKNGIREAAEKWGIEILRATVEDFDLDVRVIEARELVFEQQRAKEAAIFSAETTARQMAGVHGEMVRILIEEYKIPLDQASAIALQYVIYRQGTESGRLVDWRGEGGEIGSVIAKILAGWQVGKETLPKSKAPTKVSTGVSQETGGDTSGEVGGQPKSEPKKSEPKKRAVKKD